MYLTGHTAEVVCLCVSKTGSLCATGQLGSVSQPGQPSKLLVWDIPRQKLVWEVGGLAGSVVSVDISWDSRFIVASGENLLVIVFDVCQGEIVYTRRVESICKMCFFSQVSNSQDYVFLTVLETQIFKNTLKFDLTSMTHTVCTEKISSSNLHRKPVDAVVLGDYSVLSSTTGDLSVYSIAEGKFLGTFLCGDLPIGLMAGISGEEFACVAGMHKILLIRMSENPSMSLKIDKEVYCSWIDKISALSFSAPDRNLLLSLADGSTVAVNIDDSSKDAIKALPFYRSSSKVTVLTTHESIPKQVITAGNLASEITRWDSESLSPIHKIPLAKSDTHVTCLSVCESQIFCGLSSGQIKVLLDDKTRFEIPAAHRGPVTSIDSYVNGYYVSGGEDSVVRVWIQSKLLTQFSQSSGSILGVLIDRNDENTTVFAYNNKREIFALDLKAVKLRKKFSAIKFGNIVGMVQKTYGLDLVLVTAHYEGHIVVWDIDYDQCILSLKLDDPYRLTCLSAGSAEWTIMCGGSSGELHMVSLTDTDSHQMLKNEVSPSPVLQISPDGDIVLNSEGHIFFVTV